MEIAAQRRPKYKQRTRTVGVHLCGTLLIARYPSQAQLKSTEARQGPVKVAQARWQWPLCRPRESVGQPRIHNTRSSPSLVLLASRCLWCLWCLMLSCGPLTVALFQLQPLATNLRCQELSRPDRPRRHSPDLRPRERRHTAVAWRQALPISTKPERQAVETERHQLGRRPHDHRLGR